MRRRREIPPPPRPEGEPEIANARRLIGTGLWVAWQKLRARLSRRMDPLDIKTKSYKEMALENAAAALRAEEELDDFLYPPPPEPGVDYEEVDVPGDMRDRMDARMAEVYVYDARERGKAARQKRLRQRRLVAVAATGALGLTGVAGASVVIQGTTGVHVIDEVLSIAGRGAIETSDSRKPVGGLSGKAESYDSFFSAYRLSQSRSILRTAYISDAGRELCVARVFAIRSETDNEGNDSTCRLTRGLASALRRDAALPLGFYTPGAVVIDGLAAPDVVRISGIGPLGPLKAELSELWEPRYPGVGRMRLFTVSTRFVGSEMSADLFNRLSDPRDYSLTAHRSDGAAVPFSFAPR